MASPFPGMNPYLEQPAVWSDFHHRFCSAFAEDLTAQVRPSFIVKIDEHVYIHELPDEQRKFIGRGDVNLSTFSASTGMTPSGGVATAPLKVDLPAVDFERLAFLEIRDRHSGQIVTIIEFLSPSNKDSGPDREQYLAKRGQLLASPVHLVEIDLLRGGPRLPLNRLPDCDYYALVSRVEERPRADMWAWRLCERMPILPVPLRAPHLDAHVDLQKLLDRIYDAAGYEDYIYRTEPQPRLSLEDATWAQGFVPAGK